MRPFSNVPVLADNVPDHSDARRADKFGTRPIPDAAAAAAACEGGAMETRR